MANETDNPTLGERITATFRPITNSFRAAYKPSPTVQIEQVRDEGGFREDYWEALAARVQPGLGLAYTRIPYITMWEKIWGVTPTDNWQAYKDQYSVAKDRPIIAYFDNTVQILTFEELWNEMVKRRPIFKTDKEEIIFLENSMACTDNRLEGQYINRLKNEGVAPVELKTLSSLLSHNGSHGLAGWRRVRYLVRHRYTGKLIQLRQKWGETAVTPNHSVYDDNFNLVSPASNPTLGHITKIAKWERLPCQSSLEIEIEEPVITIANIPMPNGGVATRTYHVQHKTRRYLTGESLIAFASFLGAYVAEGHIDYDDESPSAVRISNQDITWLQQVQTLLPSFTTHKGRIDKGSLDSEEGKQTYSLTIQSKDLAIIIEHYCGRYAQNKHIPSFVFTAPEEIQRRFLEAYSKGDGLQASLNRGYYSGTSISKKLIAGLSLLFAMLETRPDSHKGYKYGRRFSLNYNPSKEAYFISQHKWGILEPRTKDMQEIDYDDYVYDMEVAGLHNFVDGIGLVVLHNTRIPFIKSAIDLHVLMAMAKGFEFRYNGPEMVIHDLEQFFEQHDIYEMVKVMLADMLIFGQCFTEIAKAFECTSKENHSMIDGWRKDVHSKAWYTDKLEAVKKHAEHFPDHVLVNPYGTISRFKPLDPLFMRVRPDAYGTQFGFVQVLTWPYITLLSEECVMIRYSPRSGYYDGAYGCVAEDSIVSTPSGYKKIQDIKENEQVYSFNNGKLSIEQVAKVFSYGKQKVYEIKTQHRKVQVTDNHPLLVLTNTERFRKGGGKPEKPKTLIWKEAKDIQRGDYIVIDKLNYDNGLPYKLKMPALFGRKFVNLPEYTTSELCRLWGFMIGDGWITHNDVYFAMSKYPELNTYYQKQFNTIFALEGTELEGYNSTQKTQYKISSKTLKEFFIANGWLNGAHEKRVPIWIYNLPIEQKIEFIKGIVDSDAWPTIQGGCEAYHIEICQLALLEDIKLLIDSIGWKCGHIRKRTRSTRTIVDHTVGPSESYYLVFYPKKVGERTDKFFLNSLLDTDHFTVEYVKERIYIGNKNVYDLNIPTTANFIANGIIAHNTSILRALLFIQTLITEFEQTIGAIMHSYLSPMFVVKIGSDRPGAPEPTTKQYQSIVRQFSQRKPGSDIFVRLGYLIKDLVVIQPPLQGLQASIFWLDYLQMQRGFALNLPKLFSDPTGISRATAQCYSEDTMVLTEHGWKYHYEVEANEKIMVYDPPTETMFLEIPESLHSYAYEGPMIQFKGREVDALVTPNHRIAYKTRWNYEKGKQWIYRQAWETRKENIVILPAWASWEGIEKPALVIDEIYLQRGMGQQLVQSITLPMDNFLKFLGYWISEGSIAEDCRYITISQKMPDKIIPIEKALENLPIMDSKLTREPIHTSSYVTEKGLTMFQINTKQFGSYLAKNFGTSRYNKHLNPEIKNLSKRQLTILLNALVLGDGHIVRDNEAYLYSTASEALANDVLEIALKIGYNARLSSYNYRHKATEYRVSIKKKDTYWLRKQNITEQPYKGMVYCFKVSTGFYLTKRNGTISFLSNTIEDMYFAWLGTLQYSLSHQFELYVMPKILRSLYGEEAEGLIREYNVPKIVWRPIRETTVEQKIQNTIALYKSGVISLKEARTDLGRGDVDPKELEYFVKPGMGGGAPRGTKPPTAMTPGNQPIETGEFTPQGETKAVEPPTGAGQAPPGLEKSEELEEDGLEIPNPKEEWKKRVSQDFRREQNDIPNATYSSSVNWEGIQSAQSALDEIKKKLARGF